METRLMKPAGNHAATDRSEEISGSCHVRVDSGMGLRCRVFFSNAPQPSVHVAT